MFSSDQGYSRHKCQISSDHIVSAVRAAFVAYKSNCTNRQSFRQIVSVRTDINKLGQLWRFKSADFFCEAVCNCASKHALAAVRLTDFGDENSCLIDFIENHSTPKPESCLIVALFFYKRILNHSSLTGKLRLGLSFHGCSMRYRRLCCCCHLLRDKERLCWAGFGRTAICRLDGKNIPAVMIRECFLILSQLSISNWSYAAVDL